jgi:steroid 5-alpha reductase family enzyme
MAMTQGFVYGTSVAITFGLQLCGFGVAFTLGTESFYDILGGVNYLALAVWSALAPGAASWAGDLRKVTMTALFVCSRSWLLLFLAWRAHERGGDSRFDEIKTKFFTFLTAWLVQGMWCFLISMPMIFVNSSSIYQQTFTILDWITIIGFGVGVVIQIAADVQKAVWVKAGRVGGFCTKGVWKYSRHPNYFGEMFQWWCAWAFAYSSSEREAGGYADPLWWFCAVSPLFTMHILLNVPATGIAHAEGRNLKRYYDNYATEYAEYRANTSILIPMIGYRYVPLFLKRTVFLDLERYEYRPTDANTDKKE